MRIIDADGHVAEGPSLAVEAMRRWPDHITPRADGRALVIEGRNYPEADGPGAGCPREHGLSTADGIDYALFADGTSQAANNVNHSQNWPNGSTKGAEILLSRPVTIDQIRGLTLEDTFTGGSGGDNWNMASMQADAALADGSHYTIAKAGFHRFSADWSGPKAKQIRISAHPIN